MYNCYIILSCKMNNSNLSNHFSSNALEETLNNSGHFEAGTVTQHGYRIATSHMQWSGIESYLHFHSSFLLVTLGSTRCWPKYLCSCHLHMRLVELPGSKLSQSWLRTTELVCLSLQNTKRTDSTKS